MNDEKYMKLAIKEAGKSVKAGGAPIGAILVKNDEVIATGWGLVWPKKDPSAHADTECMRNACKKLNSLSLSGCTLYSTIESCSMCLGCASWTGLSRIVFGAFKEDIDKNPFEIANYHAVDHAKILTPTGGGSIEVIGGVLRDECKELMVGYEDWAPIN